jgi:D-glycero-D-manno-heptose 1,7-bisphosphate phosphatase
LDRDGVLNRAVVRNGKPYPPAGVPELEVMPDAPGALADLKRLGFLLLVVTNQPDVGRGTQERATVEAMHQMLRSCLPVDDVFTCYHADADECECRKPKPGLLLRAARQYGLDLHSCFLIGDRWRDIEAGERAGCRTALIDYGYDESGPRLEPDARVASLRAAADWIVGEVKKEEGSW